MFSIKAMLGLRATCTSVLTVFIFVVGTLTAAKESSSNATHFDVLVYGATSGGIVAAIAASRHGVSVGLVVANGGGCGPSEAGANHIGGMTTGGLGKTDIGSGSEYHLIGGIAGEFYSQVAAHYHTTAPPSYNHEPHVALDVYIDMLNKSTVQMIWGGHGANIASAELGDQQIKQIHLVDGRVLSAQAFIDTSYEGDLLATSGATWTAGREAPSVYNESENGRRAGDYGDNYEFKIRVDPFDAHGQPLPLLAQGGVGLAGEGDSRVQAFNFRLCATSDVNSQAPYPKPNPTSKFMQNNQTWEIVRRVFKDPNWTKCVRTGCPVDEFPCFDEESPPLNPTTGHKRDWNNPFLGPLSSDCVEACNQSGYPHADYSGRLTIWEAHYQYYLSLLDFYSNGDGVPQSVRDNVRAWGLCADEFQATKNWPPQLYTRETRRLVGDHVFTQNTPHDFPCYTSNISIGVGDYTFDSHPTQRFACNGSSDPQCAGATPSWLKNGETENRSFAWSEGNVQLPLQPYSIPFWVMTPKRKQVTNLLVAATPSGSHIGFSSLRMEPQFMVLGHGAGTAAALFVLNQTTERVIQDVDANVLTHALLSEGQVLKPPKCSLSPGPNTPPKYACVSKFGRCVGVILNGTNSSTCMGGCPPLTPNEWIANNAFWRPLNTTMITATSDTVLKKSFAQSGELPPSMIQSVPAGTICILDSRNQVDDYWMCSDPKLQ